MAQNALGEFEHQVLLAILQAGGESYSMAIYRHLEEVLGREVQLAAVYVALRRLENKGLVTSRMVTPKEGGHQRRYFELSESALEKLRESREALLKLWSGVESRLDRS